MTCRPQGGLTAQCAMIEAAYRLGWPVQYLALLLIVLLAALRDVQLY